MTLTIDLQTTNLEVSALERSVLETLAYSDVFDYPLRMEELYRYLTTAATKEELNLWIPLIHGVAFQDGFYFLAGRDALVPLRMEREAASRKAFQRAFHYGRILGCLPYIRMVGLTGSLAMLNLSSGADMDFMLVAKPGRVWLARAFALLLNRTAHLFGDTLCPNLIVSESALEWADRNLYSAREICQMIPVSGEDVYHRLRIANKWVIAFLPNVFPEDDKFLSIHDTKKQVPVFQKILEFFLNGRLGNYLESWEMKRKIDRFTKQAGYGLETNFNADICQGNFDHHGLSAMEKYRERLIQIGIDPELHKREKSR